LRIRQLPVFISRNVPDIPSKIQMVISVAKFYLQIGLGYFAH